MLSLTKQNNSIYVEGTDHSLFPYNGVVSLPLNSVIVVTDESDIVTFRSASNYDVLFSGRIDEITINGQGVTKENIGSVFGSAFNVAGGGEGGLTPEQEERLNNAVQIADYNADKEAQATIDESQNAAIEGLSGDIEGKQDKIDDLDAIREGAEKGATALQEETDPIWNAEKVDYYKTVEVDVLVGEAKASANTAISIASSAEGIATAAHSKADEALEELEKKADKSEIPSLDGYATESWVEGKGYLTEETDPTVPQHVKDITEENIAKWNEGGKTGEVVGNNEAPKDNVGIGIFTEGEVDLEVGSLVYDGDWLVIEDANDFIIVGNDDFGTGWKFWHNSLNSGGFDNKSKYYTTDMVEIPYNEVSSNWDSFKYIHLRPDFVGHEGRIVSEVKNVKKLSSTEGGVYVYDGTEEPSKVATEKTLEGFVDVETYNQHITDQTAVDEAQNSAIEGIEGDITRIDAKIDDIELFKFPNATIIGEPTIQSGQVSNFSTENYLQFPFVLDLHNQSFQIDFCFTTSTDVSGQQNVLDSKFGIALAVKDGKGLMAISSNGTSWNIGSVTGSMNIEPNTTYYARLTWDGIQYKTFLSTDGSIYTQDMVLVGAQRPFPTNIYIGGCDLSVTGHEAHPFKGTINMNKAQLTVMGNVIWQGMDDAGLATRLATNLNNIDEVGKERIKEIVGTIPTKTSELTNDSGFLTEHQSLEDYAKTADVEANYQPKGDYATKDEIPSLDGYATEEWVEGKGYLTEHQSLAEYAKTADVNTELEKKQDVITDLDEIRDGAAKGATAIQEHQDISGKQDVIADLGEIREGAALGKTALQSFTETDPTVPAHVKAITEADIAKWNQGGGGGSTNYLVDARPSDLQDGKGIITDLVDYVKQWVTFQSYIHNVTEEESKLKFYLTETKYTSKRYLSFVYDGQYLSFTLSNKFEYVSGDKSKLSIYRKSDDTLIEDFISEDPDSIYFKFNEGPLEMRSFDIGIDKTLWYYSDKVFEGPYLVKGSEYTQIPTVNQFVKVKGKPILDSTDIDEYTINYSYYSYPSKFEFQIFKNGKAATNLKEGDVAYMRFNKETHTDSTYRYPSIKYGCSFEITVDPDTVFIHFDVKGCCCWFTVPQNLQYNLVSGTNIKTINGESILGSGNIEIQGGGGDETDPVWTAEKVNYYTKTEVDEMIGNINNALAKLING